MSPFLSQNVFYCCKTMILSLWPAQEEERKDIWLLYLGLNIKKNSNCYIKRIAALQAKQIKNVQINFS